jgi:DUF4097 and DUF4098 domain-containing protein YvlB
MFKHMRHVLIPVLLLAAQAVLASTPVDERHALKADAKVSVNNVAGSIAVETWDRNELSLTGELGDGVEKLEVTGDAAALNIRVVMPKKSGSAEDTHLQLKVPAGVSLELEGISADINVQDTRGALSVNTISGNVSLDVRSSKIDVQTVSGDLHLSAPSGDIKIGTVSGDLSLEDMRGELHAESVSGDISVSGGPFSGIKLNTVSGDVQISGNLADKAAVTVESLSGNIVVTMPASLSANLAMKTFSGGLTSDFGDVPADSRRVATRVGDGKGKLTLSSFSGDITLRRSRR